jgi:hypothetical protein
MSYGKRDAEIHSKIMKRAEGKIKTGYVVLWRGRVRKGFASMEVDVEFFSSKEDAEQHVLDWDSELTRGVVCKVEWEE